MMVMMAMMTITMTMKMITNTAIEDNEAGHNDFDELTAAGFDEAALVAAGLVAFDSSVLLVSSLIGLLVHDPTSSPSR